MRKCCFMSALRSLKQLFKRGYSGARSTIPMPPVTSTRVCASSRCSVTIISRGQVNRPSVHDDTKAPIGMFACSLRAPATRVIQSALWESLCPPGRTSWVWVEDDTELCAGAMDHLDSIDPWIASLHDSNRLVYVGTSFGFNGRVVRCKKHDEFAERSPTSANSANGNGDFP
ncbi:Uncharacterized protein PBTT_06074 [Plasmodiophora brassicae]|uniref:Uncharacterized protein n=1 Tax=Plasmodiophora brassicae TaxID=37360 RepID=A0A0G4J308_PLABS|nr:hypothetical protein PBRA_008855 [Plasmodiophora brassicae]SPQ98686.1 unnamed protein product [Plasmodiophora brassicae]